MGGGSPVSIQTMTTVKTEYAERALEEINSAVLAGADIVRVAVRDDADAVAIKSVAEGARCPIVADIHFDYRLAIKSVEAGAAKIRINPGNIGGKREIKAVCDCVKAHGVPVRVGSNSGSIEEEFLKKYGRSAEALAHSALRSARIMEECGFGDIVLSAKASDVKTTVEAYRILSGLCDYPLHLGVTEAGGGQLALVKGAVGIGSLLLDGIGDTIRVSLSAPIIEEVEAARSILRSIGLDKNFAEVISCPTCGRCRYDVFKIAENVRSYVKKATKPIKIAVMGCVVNGVGEGKDADVGIAGGKDKCVIFKNGQVLRSVDTAVAEQELLKEVDLWLAKN